MWRRRREKEADDNEVSFSTDMMFLNVEEEKVAADNDISFLLT